MVRLTLLGLLLLIAVPAAAHAALLPARNIVAEVRSFPEYPRPGEKIRFTASITDTMGAYTFVWTANGAPLASGAGVSTITSKAGPPGSATEVAVSVLDASGHIRGSGSVIVRPAEVDLVWEAKSFVPPLYEGLPLVNQGGKVSVQAVPRVYQKGATIPANQLTYLWSIEGETPTVSGFGKSSVTLTPPDFNKPFTVSVRAQTADGLNAGEGSVTITPAKPLAVVYEDQPLTGLALHRAVTGSETLGLDEITYRLYPVYARGLAGMTYEWLLNGTAVKPTGSDARSTTFRKDRTATGTFRVGVSFKTPGVLFENGSSSFTVAIQ